MLGTSCEKRIGADDQPGGNAVDVTAKLPDGRIWNDGDQITINNRKYTITEGGGSSDALFSGVAGSDTYAAVYDFGFGKIGNNILTMSLPSGQGGDIVHSHPLADLEVIVYAPSQNFIFSSYKFHLISFKLLQV